MYSIFGLHGTAPGKVEIAILFMQTSNVRVEYMETLFPPNNQPGGVALPVFPVYFFAKRFML